MEVGPENGTASVVLAVLLLKQSRRQKLHTHNQAFVVWKYSVVAGSKLLHPADRSPTSRIFIANAVFRQEGCTVQNWRPKRGCKCFYLYCLLYHPGSLAGHAMQLLYTFNGFYSHERGRRLLGILISLACSPGTTLLLYWQVKLPLFENYWEYNTRII